MRTPKQYIHPPKRIFRSEITHCPICAMRLRRHVIVSRRIVITLEGPLQVVHWGYRCPSPTCSAPKRTYRSAAADALALPGFTFGLDLVLLVGHLRLAKHHTQDEIHAALQARLAPWGQTISRRNILYLIEAYETLLRAAHQPGDSPSWQAWLDEVHANGGVIIAIDGIQPDKGNETVYLVRDVLTGRVLCAENVLSSETEVIKRLLAPVVALNVPVLGAISDAQVSLINAIAALWPHIPHQTCQFHYLREVARPIADQDRAVRTAMRKEIQTKVRLTRMQIATRLTTVAAEDVPAPSTFTAAEAAQLRVLDGYALGVQAALNLDGKMPFAYPGIDAYDALEEIATSLEQIEKGAHPPVGS